MKLSIFIIFIMLPFVTGEGNWRIIGGKIIDEEDMNPWLVFLSGSFFPSKYICGASLISDRWLLTAAHCFIQHDGTNLSKPSHWTARLASTETKETWNSIKGWFEKVFGSKDRKQWNIDVEKIILHPQYDGKKNWTNDIALMKLKESLPIGDTSDKIGAIKLPTVSLGRFPADGQMCLMAGWGCKEFGRGYSYSAREVSLPIVDDRSCRLTWEIDNKTRICAGRYHKNIGVCNGDSGGPLACKHGDDWIQVGIASYAYSRDTAVYPAVFTRVSYYINWINTTVAIN